MFKSIIVLSTIVSLALCATVSYPTLNNGTLVNTTGLHAAAIKVASVAGSAGSNNGRINTEALQSASANIGSNHTASNIAAALTGLRSNLTSIGLPPSNQTNVTDSLNNAIANLNSNSTNIPSALSNLSSIIGQLINPNNKTDVQNLQNQLSIASVGGSGSGSGSFGNSASSFKAAAPLMVVFLTTAFLLI